MHSCYLYFRPFLGFSDLDVESVFRTTDGFILPWISWTSHDPQGTAGHAHGSQDCGGRAITGGFGDYDCDDNHIYYCEGELIWKLNTILKVFSNNSQLLVRVSPIVLYRYTSMWMKKAWLPCLSSRRQHLLHHRWIWGIHCSLGMKHV